MFNVLFDVFCASGIVVLCVFVVIVVCVCVCAKDSPQCNGANYVADSVVPNTVFCITRPKSPLQGFVCATEMKCQVD